MLMVHCQLKISVLGNQSGKKVQMGSETDQRAIMMSLMLHTNAKQLIKAQNY
ncbi:hypothetical protein RchiOBHm_Chr7g0241351 [Rosa chinensis]|uniref:Uncharacterized protein n=1 Tax=Rosa chinensis TaxID=74649 RepID=A0A2P6PI85_ROSCH|nr:hypothetical protein RchiOBHm_Chr7g0241351 [Rosa chinensis]